MPISNLDNRRFSDTEKQAVTEALKALQAALNNKTANLTAEERQQYGSVNEQNKLIINKVKEYHDNEPAKSSPDVNWEEFYNDYDARAFFQQIIQQLEELTVGCRNSKILHDYDNYQAALDDYEYAKYKAHTNSTGYETKVNEIKQFFNRTGTSHTEETTD